MTENEKRKGNTADALATVWFTVATVWLFMQGYALYWLAGMGLSLGGVLVVRRLRKGK